MTIQEEVILNDRHKKAYKVVLKRLLVAANDQLAKIESGQEMRGSLGEHISYINDTFDKEPGHSIETVVINAETKIGSGIWPIFSTTISDVTDDKGERAAWAELEHHSIRGTVISTKE